MKPLKRKTNLIILNIFVVTISLVFSVLLYLNQMQKNALQQARETQERAIRVFWQLLLEKGRDFRIVDNKLMAGDYVINDNFELPDKIRDIFGGTATIFMGDTRVATNVPLTEGRRAVGTKLTGPAYEAIFTHHTQYRGEAPILGAAYFTAYDPIHDAHGNIIGILYVGIKKSEFLATFDRQKTAFISGAVVLEILLVTLVWMLFRERSRTEESIAQMATQLQLITDSVPAAIAYVDREQRYRFANKSYCAMFSCDAASIADKTIADVLREPELDDRETAIRRVLAGEPLSFPNKLHRDESGTIHLQTAYIPHRTGNGAVIGFFIQHHDVSDLANAEERYRTMFNTTGTGTMVIEEDGTISLVNDEACRIMGYPRAELEGRMNWTRLVAPHELERLQEYNRQRKIDPDLPPKQYECDIVRPDGTVRTGIVHVGIIPGGTQTIASFLDITERKNLEEALTRQLDFLQTLIDTIPNPIFYKDRHGRYLGCNRAFEEYLGYKREEIEGKTVYDLAPPEIADRYKEMDDELINTPGIQRYEAPVVYADGNSHDIVFHKATFLDKDQRPQGIVGIMLDVTERKRMEDALIAAETQFRALVEQSMVGVYIIQDGVFAYVNPKMADIFGYTREELSAGMNHLELTADEDRAMSSEHIRRRIDGEISSSHYEFNGKRKDGTIRRIEVYGSSTVFRGKPAVIGTLLDITERKAMEDALRLSEERYRTVFETTGTAMLTIEADTTISLVNVEFCTLTGYSREEVEERMSWLDVVATADRERMLGYHRRRRIDPSSAPSTYEFQLVNRMGEVRDIHTSIAMIPGTDRSVQSYLDITALKQSERLFAGEREIMAQIVADTPLNDVLAILCRIIEQQKFGALCSILLVNETGTRLLHAAAPSLPEEYNRLIDGTRIGMNIGSCGTAAFAREQVIVSDIATDPRWAKYRKLPLSFGLRACWSWPIFSTSGDLLGTFAVYYPQVRTPESRELELGDRASHLASIVIQRHRATETLRQMQIHQRAILDNIPDLIWLKDRESRFITVNRAFAAASNLTPEEVAGKSDSDLYPEDLAAKYRQDDYGVMISRSQERIEELFAGSDGSRRWIETFKMPVYGMDGEMIGTTGIARDINERKLAEQALRESEERFHQIFSQNEDAVLLLQSGGISIIDANPAAETLTGYPLAELREIPPSRFIDPLDLGRLIENVTPDAPLQLDIATCTRKGGRRLSVAIRAKVLRLRSELVIHCSIRDITEKLRIEEQVRGTQAKLIHANKMTSIGMLASSVAHEINNPNNCISVNSAMLADIWQDAQPLLEASHREHGEFNLRGIPFSKIKEFAPRLLNGITEASRRITAIVNNMRDYVREDKSGRHGEVDVNGLIRNAALILWHHIHMHTDNFRMSLEEDIPMARGNGQQIEQVVINLITNALQALPEKKSGVYVTTRQERERRKIVIEVRDEGSGMDEDTIAHLAEPFFTTRTAQGGTGLGLFISTSIIKEHDGTMEFSSEPDRGTTVTITLPMATSMVSHEQP